MTAALFLLKNVNLSLEVLVGLYTAGLSQNLATLDLVTLNTTHQSADVVASLGEVQGLAEHLQTGDNGLCCICKMASILH
ncbi:MAG: hypothetical protein II278_03380, partial [Bacteroidaceae bacterium]|nr:hypothetical protein [Bacteroidaceae bacterium]